MKTLARVFLVGIALALSISGSIHALAKISRHPDGVILIHNVQELQNIQNNLSGHYQLANTFDAVGANFAPIGTSAAPFSGTLNGNGFTITNLTISNVSDCSSNFACAGIFGYASADSTISNLRLTGVSVNVTCQIRCSVGATAGIDLGVIKNVFVAGTITTYNPQAHGDPTVGGIAGQTESVAFARADVTINVSGHFCENFIGGLAGDNAGSIKFSSATGQIGLDNSLGCATDNAIGGLVGGNDLDASISDCFATVVINDRSSDGGAVFDGGLVGEFEGSIDHSYSAGSVQTTGAAGGLAGFMFGAQGHAPKIQNSFSKTSVQSGGWVAGGVVGNAGYGAIDRVYSTGHITNSNGNVGGFIGYYQSGMSISNSYWDLNASGINDPTRGCGNVSNCSGVIGLKTKNFLGKIPGGLNTADWMQVNFPFHNDYPKLWAPSFPIIAFPLSGYTPYSMPIITVFDHTLQTAPASGVAALYTCDQVVRAFEGSTGELKYGSDSPQCKYPGYKQQSGKNFVLGGVNYVGLPAKYLEYDGHPGFDYGAVFHSPVYAAVSGTIFYPWKAVGTGSNNDTYCRFHAMAQIPDSAPTYRLYYLHLATHPAKKGQSNPTCSSSKDTDGETVTFTSQPNCYTDLNGNPINPPTLPLPEGTHTNAGCEIALSGDAGVPGSPHLHFEVQQMVPAAGFAGDPGRVTYFACYDERNRYKQGTAGVDPYCMPADPYGYVADDTQCNGDASSWTGDIWQCLTGIPSRRFWAQ